MQAVAPTPVAPEEPPTQELEANMSDVTFHKVATTDQIDEDEAMQVIVEGKEVAIINLGGEFYAMDDICSHAYASMADGYIEGECIECPLHGAQFNIKTGKAETPPATVDLATYEIRIEGSDILVGLPNA